MHLPRRMAFGKVQLGEIVIVGLDVGTFGDGKSHVGEDRVDLFEDLAERMNPALLGGCLAQRQRDVDGLGGKPCVEGGGFQHVAARGQRLRDLVLGQIDRRALGLAFVRRHFAERRQQRRDRALLAERCDAHGFQCGLVARGGDLAEDGLIRGCEVGHGDDPFGNRSRCRHAEAVIARRLSRAIHVIGTAGVKTWMAGYWMPRLRGARHRSLQSTQRWRNLRRQRRLGLFGDRLERHRLV